MIIRLDDGATVETRLPKSRDLTAAAIVARYKLADRVQITLVQFTDYSPTEGALVCNFPVVSQFEFQLKNHACAVAVYMMIYNFARIHKTLRCTPAMEAGIADDVWSRSEERRVGKEC